MTPEVKRKSDRRGSDSRANVVPITFENRRKSNRRLEIDRRQQ